MKDDWVAAALFDDSLVASLLSRLKQSSSSSSSFSCHPHPKPLSLPLGWGWGHRQPRSKPSPNPNPTNKVSTTNTAAAAPTITTTTNTTRCSPTTPLSWSGGAASPSDGAYDDCSTRPPQSSSSSDPSRSKGAFTNDVTNIYSNIKKSKKKKTFAELKEEESSLLKERVTLKRELASLHVTLKEQKARSENLKRFKFDLNLLTSGEICGTSGDTDVAVSNQCTQMEASSSEHAYSAMPRHAVQDGFGSSSSCRVEKEVDMQKSCFVLPDLNMVPSDEEVGPEILNAIR